MVEQNVAIIAQRDLEKFTAKHKHAIFNDKMLMNVSAMFLPLQHELCTSQRNRSNTCTYTKTKRIGCGIC